MLTAAILVAYFFALFSIFVLYFHIKHLIHTFYWLQKLNSVLADKFYSDLTRFEKFFVDRM